MSWLPRNIFFGEQQSVTDFLANCFIKFNNVWHEFVSNAEIKIKIIQAVVFINICIGLKKKKNHSTINFFIILLIFIYYII